MGDENVARAPAFQIFGEVPHALGVDFVGEEEALVLHFRGNVGGLAAGGCGEVEDAFARLGVEDFGDGLGGGFLQVVESGGVVGVEAGPGFTFEDAESCIGPGEGLQRERGDGLKFFGGEFEGVDAQAHVRRRVVAGEEGVEFIAEEGFHAGEEGGREQG